jgi:hypothetical protein
LFIYFSVIVTSATSAFKENMDLDEEDDEEIAVNNHNRHQVIEEPNGTTGHHDDGHGILNKNLPNSSLVNTKTKTTTKLSVQDNNNSNDQQTGVVQQDEWEEFEDSNSKYDQLRLKFARPANDEDENYDDDNYYDENNHHTNLDDNSNNIEQQKDKHVWKLDQVKQIESNDLPTEKVEESLPPPSSSSSKPATSGAYRPPQLRGNSSVTIVSGINQRISKKEKPNLASTEEFPTLGAAVNKK